MLHLRLVLLFAVLGASGTAAAAEQGALPASPIVTLTLCPASLALAPGEFADVTGETYNEGNASVLVEARSTWLSTGTNESGGWRANAPPKFALGPHAFHALALRVRAPKAGDGFNDTLEVALLNATMASTWTALRIPVVSSAQPAATNDSACVRTAFAVPAIPPNVPKVVSADAAPVIPRVASWAAAAAGVAAVAGAGAWVARSESRWLRVVALFTPLFTRLAPSRLLDQEVRERIYAAIQGQPGIHFVALRDRLQLSTGVATHHLRILERSRLIASRREGRFRSYYPLTERLPPVPKTPLNPTASRLLEMVKEAGEMPFSTLPGLLGVSKSTVSYNVKHLCKEGLVELVLEPTGVWIVRDLQMVRVRTSS